MPKLYRLYATLKIANIRRCNPIVTEKIPDHPETDDVASSSLSPSFVPWAVVRLQRTHCCRGCGTEGESDEGPLSLCSMAVYGPMRFPGRKFNDRITIHQRLYSSEQRDRYAARVRGLN